MNILRHIRLRRHRIRRAMRTYPVVVNHIRQRGLIRILHKDGSLIEVCDFCLGNCGQCGITPRVGNITFNMDAMIERLQGGRIKVTSVRS